MIINCVAIDDEPLALSLVCTFIGQTSFLRLKANYVNGITALEALIDSRDIQLAFMDIQMPDVSGMQMARIISNAHSGAQGPRIIFTTAYNHYAVEGYKVNALDYLLKPFNYEEFLRAANKVRASLEAAPASSDSYLFLKVEHQLVQLAYDDILYIEAFRDYVKVHVRGVDKPVMSLATLKNLEEKLPPGQFMRVHKSFIVSLGKINAISKSAVHIGDNNIAIGDQYRESFRQFIERWTV